MVGGPSVGERANGAQQTKPYFFLAVFAALAATWAFFFWSALLALACFWPVFFWLSFGERSPMGLVVSAVGCIGGMKVSPLDL